jgi:hypothetical protein
MCAGKSCIQPTDESSVTGKSIRSVYRVLRRLPRGGWRSVDRDHAGRNAKPEGSSVKVLSSVKELSVWWPSHYVEAKAVSADYMLVGTTGVRVHGMYGRLNTEPGRSLGGRVRMRRLPWRGIITKSGIIPPSEVRCSHSSKEVG